MKKAAVIFAPGFEEGEALTIVDIIRRAGIHCDAVGLTEFVTGGHDITVRSDVVLSEETADYDMIVLPGGYGGVDSMMGSELLLDVITKMNDKGKFVCAMCAAPVVLDKLGLLENRSFTAYKGYDKKISSGNFLEDKIVIDGNIVTSRGPATAYAFAYKLVELLGGDSLAVKNRMVYFNAFDVKEDE